MGRGLAILGTILLALAGSAQAHGHHRRHRRHIVPAACPAGLPIQTITVVNQAKARPVALAEVENAVVAQSIQLRAAWDTPCVQFGPGGWPLYLRIGGTVHGIHLGPPVRLQVYTGGYDRQAWSQDFSHEVVESLVDPINTDYFANGEGSELEIADPVEWRGYRLDGVYVNDFVLPAWYAGAMLDTPQTAATGTTCPLRGGQCTFVGPLIAPPNAPPPYDEMDILAQPWDVVSN